MKHPQILNARKILFVALSAAIVLAVSARAEDSTAPAATTNAAAANAPATNAVPTVTVKEYLKDPGQFAGHKLVLQGFVTDVCKRKGCWAILHDPDSEANAQVRVKQDEEGPTFKPFLPDLLGHNVQVTGEVTETKIDGAYLDKWESNVKAAKERAEKSAGEPSEGFEKTLKQIADYRDRATHSKRGYLVSYSLAVSQWQEAPAQH